jgi:hypothetical protein
MPLMRRGPGIVGMAARTAVVAGTATAVSGRVARRQQAKYAAEQPPPPQEYQQEMAPQPAAAPAAPAEPDYMAELQQLAQLKAQGVITDEEFEAKKKQLLGI